MLDSLAHIYLGRPELSVLPGLAQPLLHTQ